MATPDDLRSIAQKVYDEAKHKRQVELVAEAGEAGNSYYQADEQNADSDLSTKYGWIADGFEKFTAPRLEPLGDVAHYFGMAYDHVVSRDASYLNEDSLLISEWRGDAKKSFVDNYVTPWETYREYHAQLIEALKTTAEGHAEIYSRMRKKAYEIGEVTYEALKDLDPYLPTWLTEEEGQDLTVKVAGTVAGLAATPLTGIVGKAIWIIGIVDAAENVVDAVGSVEAERVDDLLAEMKTQLDQLETDVLAEEDKINETLRQNLDEFERSLDSIVPPQPELAAVDPDDPGGGIKPPAED